MPVRYFLACVDRRLKSPDSDETFQSYSTFTSNYRSPAEYEEILVQASKQRATAVKAYQFRESYETALVRSCLARIVQDF